MKKKSLDDRIRKLIIRELKELNIVLSKKEISKLVILTKSKLKYLIHAKRYN